MHTNHDNHEEILKLRLKAEEEVREIMLSTFGYYTLLRDHYTKPGVRHPDDQNLPLNLWDQTDPLPAHSQKKQSKEQEENPPPTPSLTEGKEEAEMKKENFNLPC